MKCNKTNSLQFRGLGCFPETPSSAVGALPSAISQLLCLPQGPRPRGHPAFPRWGPRVCSQGALCARIRRGVPEAPGLSSSPFIIALSPSSPRSGFRRLMPSGPGACQRAEALGGWGLRGCSPQPRLLVLTWPSDSGGSVPQSSAAGSRAAPHASGALPGQASTEVPLFPPESFATRVTPEPHKTSAAVLPSCPSAPSSVYPFPLTFLCNQQRETRPPLPRLTCRAPYSDI